MKNIIIVFFSALISFPTIAQIQFAKGTWADVQTQAKKENKHIFVDAYTQWCGPCKDMAKNVFTTKEVGDFYNKNFVNYKFDMEKEGGEEFAKAYQVNAYPTLVYFSPKGEIVHKGVGGRSSEDFIALGETSLNPETQHYTLKKKFEQGEKSKEFLEKLSASGQEANDDELLQKIAPQILNDLPQSEWASNENFRLTFQAIVVDEKILEKVLKMRPEFEKMAGVDNFNDALMNTFNKQLTEAIQSKNEKNLAPIRKKIYKMFSPKDAPMMETRLEIAYYEQIGDTEKAQKATQKLEILQKK